MHHSHLCLHPHMMLSLYVCLCVQISSFNKDTVLLDNDFILTWLPLQRPYFQIRSRSLVAQLVKNLPAMQETWVRSLGWEDPLEKGTATHSSILAWRIPWTVCIVHGVSKSWTQLSDFHFSRGWDPIQLLEVGHSSSITEAIPGSFRWGARDTETWRQEKRHRCPRAQKRYQHSTRFCSFPQPWHQIAWNPLTYKETQFYLPSCQDQSGWKATSPDGHGCSVTKSCPALWDTMDCSLPGSSVHGIFQARILEWIAISSCRWSSWPRYRTHISCIGRWIL